MLDFIFEVYHQLLANNLLQENYYGTIAEFVKGSNLNTHIQVEYLEGAKQSKDSIINILLFLRVYNVILDEEILAKKNLEIKLGE